MQTRYDAATYHLLRAELAAGRQVCLHITGSSMRPLLQTGDRIWVAPVQPAHLTEVVLVRVGGGDPAGGVALGAEAAD